MIMKCRCCGNQDPDEFFDTPEFTMCMACGEVGIDYTVEETDKVEVVFFD